MVSGCRRPYSLEDERGWLKELLSLRPEGEGVLHIKKEGPFPQLILWHLQNSPELKVLCRLEPFSKLEMTTLQATGAGSEVRTGDRTSGRFVG